MKRKIPQSNNCTITFECKELGLKFVFCKFSKKLQKCIDQCTQPPQRCIITGSHQKFFEQMVSMWDKGQLILPDKNNINRLAEFIYQHYDVKHEKNPKKSLSLESIRSETYLYHEPK